MIKINHLSIYIDAKVLYGWTMSQYLPTGKFKWLPQDEIDRLSLNTMQKDNPDGFILEVKRLIPYLCNKYMILADTCSYIYSQE